MWHLVGYSLSPAWKVEKISLSQEQFVFIFNMVGFFLADNSEVVPVLII